MKQYASITIATVFALLILALVIWPEEMHLCSAFWQFFYHPLDAVSGVPWLEAEGIPPGLGFDYEAPFCSSWPSALESWLTLWLPICGVLVACGAITFRLSDKQALSGSAFSSAVAAGLTFGLPLLDRYMQSAPRTQSFAIVFGAILLGAMLGLAGGAFARGLKIPSTR